MYGMVNNAIRVCISDHFGKNVWHKVLKNSQASTDDFISMQPYPDETTVSLIVSAAEVTGKTVDELLEQVGEFWIEYALRSDYASMLTSAGDTLPEILKNLDALHSRLGRVFTGLKPPTFWCSSVDTSHQFTPAQAERALILHYVSEREGLCAFVVGLINGLGKMLGITIRIKHIVKKSEGAEHDEFLVEHG